MNVEINSNSNKTDKIGDFLNKISSNDANDHKNLIINDINQSFQLKTYGKEEKLEKEEEIHNYSRTTIRDLSTKKLQLVKSYDENELQKEKEKMNHLKELKQLKTAQFNSNNQNSSIRKKSSTSKNNLNDLKDTSSKPKNQEFVILDDSLSIKLKEISKSTKLGEMVDAEFYNLNKSLTKILSADKTINTLNHNNQKSQSINLIAKQNQELMKFFDTFATFNKILEKSSIISKQVNSEVTNDNLNNKEKPNLNKIKPLINIRREQKSLEKQYEKISSGNYLEELDREIHELNEQLEFLTKENRKIKQEYSKLEKKVGHDHYEALNAELIKKRNEAHTLKKLNNMLIEKIGKGNIIISNSEKEILEKEEIYYKLYDMIGQMKGSCNDINKDNNKLNMNISNNQNIINNCESYLHNMKDIINEDLPELKADNKIHSHIQKLSISTISPVSKRVQPLNQKSNTNMKYKLKSKNEINKILSSSTNKTVSKGHSKNNSNVKPTSPNILPSINKSEYKVYNQVNINTKVNIDDLKDSRIDYMNNRLASLKTIQNNNIKKYELEFKKAEITIKQYEANKSELSSILQEKKIYLEQLKAKANNLGLKVESNEKEDNLIMDVNSCYFSINKNSIQEKRMSNKETNHVIDEFIENQEFPEEIKNLGVNINIEKIEENDVLKELEEEVKQDTDDKQIEKVKEISIREVRKNSIKEVKEADTIRSFKNELIDDLAKITIKTSLKEDLLINNNSKLANNQSEHSILINENQKESKTSLIQSNKSIIINENSEILRNKIAQNLTIHSINEIKEVEEIAKPKESLIKEDNILSSNLNIEEINDKSISFDENLIKSQIESIKSKTSKVLINTIDDENKLIDEEIQKLINENGEIQNSQIDYNYDIIGGISSNHSNHNNLLSNRNDLNDSRSSNKNSDKIDKISTIRDKNIEDNAFSEQQVSEYNSEKVHPLYNNSIGEGSFKKELEENNKNNNYSNNQFENVNESVHSSNIEKYIKQETDEFQEIQLENEKTEVNIINNNFTVNEQHVAVNEQLKKRNRHIKEQLDDIENIIIP